MNYQSNYFRMTPNQLPQFMPPMKNIFSNQMQQPMSPMQNQMQQPMPSMPSQMNQMQKPMSSMPSHMDQMENQMSQMQQPMPSQMNQMPGEMNMMYPHEDFVSMVQNCSATCFHTMSELIGRQDSRQSRQKQIKLLHDCARICESQAIFTVVGSTFDKQHAQLCAMICEECARECSRFNDELSQHCARMCRECAAACRHHASMTM